MSTLINFLQTVLSEFAEHVYIRRCYGTTNLPRPSLENVILPMFRIDRWATGRGQHTSKFHHRLEPALMLASRLLTEDCVLAWFTHLTFGTLQRKSVNSEEMYIMPRRGENSPQARNKVRDNLRQLGEVVTFMFAPASDTNYAAAYYNKTDLPWYKDFRSTDWPSIPEKYRFRRSQPCIVMNAQSQEYFERGYSHNSSPAQRYRTLFVFAAALVHECAHAYGYWIGIDPTKEPLWSRDEKYAELGFSWESNVLGQVINPLWDDMNGCKILISSRIEYFAHWNERSRAINKVIDRPIEDLRFTAVDLSKLKNGRFLLNPKDFRGNKWFGDEWTPGYHYVCCIHAITMDWIISWFQEAEWVQRRKHWERKGEYKAPPLGESFLLIYEHQKRGSTTLWRLLDPKFPPDTRLMKYMDGPASQSRSGTGLL